MRGFDDLSAIIARDLFAPLLADVSDIHGLVLRRDGEAAIAVREQMDEVWRLRAELSRPGTRSPSRRGRRRPRGLRLALGQACQG